jgi:hypothetical protein
VLEHVGEAFLDDPVGGDVDPASTGGFRPYVPAGWFAAIVGVSALLALVALSVPTWQALCTRPVEAIGIRE